MGGLDVILLVEKIELELGTDPGQWFTPVGYQSAALAVLDSIYSTGNHYSGVRKLVRRYEALRAEEGAVAGEDRSGDLVAAFERWGGTDGFVARTEYKWKTSTSKGAPYKAYAAREAARALAMHGIETRLDAQTHLMDRQMREDSELARRWRRIRGQSSGLTWNYFLMLVGIPGVKADRMVQRFVGTAVGRPGNVGPAEASALVEAAADVRGLHATKLDHTIWRFQSGRDFLIPDSM